MQYFSHQKISEAVYRIIEASRVCCYLLIGQSRAMLLDTCAGLGDVRAYAQQLTDKPLFCVLTHGHYDHCGGAGHFGSVYLNPADTVVLEDGKSVEKRVAYTKGAYAAGDFTPGFNGQILPLQDGDVFDLGGLHVEMIAVPGHTQGMMCALIREERTIVFGDACGVAVLLFEPWASTVSEYRRSLLKLKAREPEYDTILRNHGDFTSPKELLDEVIECCGLILQGKDEHVPITFLGHDLFCCYRDRRGHGNVLYTPEKAK